MWQWLSPGFPEDKDTKWRIHRMMSGKMSQEQQIMMIMRSIRRTAPPPIASWVFLFCHHICFASLLETSWKSNIFIFTVIWVGLKACWTPGDISSELYGDWLWDENFKSCLIFTHFSCFSPFSGYRWWNNTLSSLENFSLNSILFFLFLMSHPDNGGFLKIAQKRDSISKKTSFCIMVINTDHQESWFLSVGHPLCALR